VRAPKILTVFILAMVVLGLAESGTAQAFESSWMIEGEPIAGSQEVSLVSKPVTLSVPFLGIAIECEEAGPPGVPVGRKAPDLN